MKPLYEDVAKKRFQQILVVIFYFLTHIQKQRIYMHIQTRLVLYVAIYT